LGHECASDAGSRAQQRSLLEVLYHVALGPRATLFGDGSGSLTGAAEGAGFRARDGGVGAGGRRPPPAVAVAGGPADSEAADADQGSAAAASASMALDEGAEAAEAPQARSAAGAVSATAPAVPAGVPGTAAAEAFGARAAAVSKATASLIAAAAAPPAPSSTGGGGAGAGAGASAGSASSSSSHAAGAGAAASSAGGAGFVSRDEIAKAEEDAGAVVFRVITNDGSRSNLIWLTQVRQAARRSDSGPGGPCVAPAGAPGCTSAAAAVRALEFASMHCARLAALAVLKGFGRGRLAARWCLVPVGLPCHFARHPAAAAPSCHVPSPPLVPFTPFRRSRTSSPRSYPRCPASTSRAWCVCVPRVPSCIVLCGLRFSGVHPVFVVLLFGRLLSTSTLRDRSAPLW
jgi:hypothetical protein